MGRDFDEDIGKSCEYSEDEWEVGGWNIVCPAAFGVFAHSGLILLNRGLVVK